MRFSVVITTHNRRALLERAIHSVLDQDLSVETIVIDDASSDDTCETITKLQHDLQMVGDYRLVYYRNPKNIGHSASVNRGVELASGEWIKFLDDDDYLGPQCLAEMAKAIEMHPSAVLCSCRAEQVDEYERPIEQTATTGPGRAFYIPQEDVHYGMLLEVVPFGTPVQVAAKRTAFLRSGGWNSNLDGNCDDIDSWIRIAQYGDALFLNQCLVFRTVWSGSWNQTFAIDRRLQTNVEMKRKIHRLVHEKYRDCLPSFESVEHYLHLHWGFVAIAAGRLRTGWQMIASAGASLMAWRMLLRALVFRQSPWHQTYLPEHQFADRAESELDSPAAVRRHAALEFASRSSMHWGQRRQLQASLSFSLGEGDLMRSLIIPFVSVETFKQAARKPQPTHMRTRKLRQRIRLRNSIQALAAGDLMLAGRLLWAIAKDYVRRLLLALYPKMPPIAKIPIAASSHEHAEMTIDILKRIVNRQHHSLTETLPVLRQYLRIRCAIAAFREKYFLFAVCTFFPACFSLRAWRLWLRLVRERQIQRQ